MKLLGVAPFFVSTVASIAASEYFFNRYSYDIESYLETHKKSKLKSWTRLLYNIHLQVSSILIKGYQYLVNRASPCQGTYGGKVDHMIVYPIKSASKGIVVTEWEVDEYGLKYDRQYMFSVFDEKLNCYKPLTLKDSQKLALLDAKYNATEKTFTFTYPIAGSETNENGILELPCAMTPEFVAKYSSYGEKQVDIKLWAVKMQGYIFDKILTEEFLESIALPKNAVLLFSPNGKLCRVGSPKSVDRSTLFQDYYPILLCSQESYDQVKGAVGEAGDYLRLETFRPNLIIKDVERPFVEDLYYKFDILSHTDNSRFNFTAPLKCIRCSVPNIDIEKGVMDKKGTVSKVMSTYRRVDETNPYSSCFGIYVINHQSNFTIKQGDTVDVLSKKCKKMDEDPFDG
ncbi:hypothetical protein CANARDRAFT_5563 [[Candida] arabinofermentans NRRL YB-2248]|uniref:MOSC domain-containing protein n=1 Tax=[Candida] arabinofermentans NRRL YB-2248 TaxID=983967 RepID=A0A1E4T959_9ASCO|nr:hypothetical protein CANARDRAFT_5563 [[Candida] arabinofermentans NRRL YB-2248]